MSRSYYIQYIYMFTQLGCTRGLCHGPLLYTVHIYVHTTWLYSRFMSRSYYIQYIYMFTQLGCTRGLLELGASIFNIIQRLLRTVFPKNFHFHLLIYMESLINNSVQSDTKRYHTGYGRPVMSLRSQYR